MRKLFIAAISVAFALSLSAQSRFTPAVDAEVAEIMSKMTLDEKLKIIGGSGWMTTNGVERLGIKGMKFSDGPQGVGSHGKSTAYPSAVTLAATWNPDFAYKYGTALAADCKAKGVNVLLGPAVNIYRAPMCGRNFEYMGEDPFLASRMAVGYIKGLQDHGIMGVVKHFALNNSEYDRNFISNDADERTLNEIYFPAFKAAVQEAEVGALMTSYNLYKGIYTTESPWLLSDILRKQWGFKGMVMSDWEAAHHDIVTARSGLDLEMPSAKYTSAEKMKYYLVSGDVTMRMIDDKVRHILHAQLAFGFKGGAGKVLPEQENPACVATALDVAEEAVVLLKNRKNTLPVNPKRVKRIVVTGNNAVGFVRGGGSGNVSPVRYTSMLDGIGAVGKEHGVQVDYIDPQMMLPQIAYTDGTLKEHGFNAAYYANARLEGNPVRIQTEKHISYQWPGNGESKGLPATDFSVRWTGVLCSDKTLDYEFVLGGDDGYRIYIDDVPVVEDWTNGAFRTKVFKKTLEAGVKYNMRIEFYQGGGSAAVDFSWNTPQGSTLDGQVAKKLAEADMIVACVGFDALSECEGSDRTFALSKQDSNLLAGLSQLNKPVVGILNSGGSVEMQEWEPKMSALLWAGYAGQEGGTAVGRILFGDVNPSGHLPMTFEKRWEDNPTYNSYYDPDGDKHVEYTEGVFVGYRGYDKLGREVQYPFGYGLSYTKFKLENAVVEAPASDGTVAVSFSLKNTGKHAGAQVVQAYVGKAGKSAVERPSKELRGFSKVELKPGEKRTVKIVLPKDAFSYYDVNVHRFVKDPGVYNIMLGFSSRDIVVSKTADYR